MKVYGLRVIGNAVTIIGDRKVVTWDLPAEDRDIPNAKLTLKDSVRTKNLRDPSPRKVISATISPDSRRIAFIERAEYGTYDLSVYHGSTGERISCNMNLGGVVWFAPEGHDLWFARDSFHTVTLRESNRWKLVGDAKRGVGIGYPPEGCPWASSYGYWVTNDWWILGPDGKRHLMLPPTWQSDAVRQAWKGDFSCCCMVACQNLFFWSWNPDL